MKVCKGHTLKGKKCKKKTKDEYCHLHKVAKAIGVVVDTVEVKEHSVIECPICFEEILQKDVKNTILKCGHIHCMDCISSLRTLSCPMCRGPLELKEGNFSDKIIEKINKNIKDDRDAEELRNREALIAQFGTQPQFIDTTNQLLLFLTQVLESRNPGFAGVLRVVEQPQNNRATYQHARVRHTGGGRAGGGRSRNTRV